MPHIFKLLILLFSCLSCSLLVAQPKADILTENEKQFLKQKKTLFMCVGPNFMPFEDIVEGKYVGMIAEYIKIVSHNIGIPIVLVPTSDWNETIKKAKSRECDLIPFIIRTPEREKFLNFTQPYIGEPLVIVTSNDRPFVVDVGDIQNRKIGIVRGYAYVELLKSQYPGINIIEVESVGEGLTMLENEELYGYLDGLNVIGYNIQELGIQNLKINGTLINNDDVCIGSRNDMPILNQILDKGLRAITTIQKNKIKNSWLRVTYEHRFDYILIIQFGVVITMIFGFMLYHQNILRKHNKALEVLSETDKLTNINNRLKLDKFLQFHLDLFERYHETFSIILIDIDNFKKFNDTFGHLIGDKVLEHVASLLKHNCRKLDMIGRWGGEEFLMICPKTNLDEISVLAESLRRIIEDDRLKNVEGVTISLGVAEMTVNDNFNTIIGRADKALFSAKENGRNRVGVGQ